MNCAGLLEAVWFELRRYGVLDDAGIVARFGFCQKDISDRPSIR